MASICPECKGIIGPNKESCQSCGAILSAGFDEVDEADVDREDTDPDGLFSHEHFDTNPGERDEHETEGASAWSSQPRHSHVNPVSPEGSQPRAGSYKGARRELGRTKDEEERPFPRIPWGSLILITLYLLSAGSLLFYDYWTSEHAAIDRHMRSAERLLGHRMGKGSSTQELIEAAEHYVAALAIEPHMELPHKRLDVIKRRLEENESSLPEELEKKHAALSARVQMERAQARRGLFADMPVNPTDRFRLREQRSKAKRNSYIFFGGLVALLGWIFIRASKNKLSTRETRGPVDDEDDGRFIS